MRRAILPLLSIVGLLLPGMAGAQKVPAGPRIDVGSGASFLTGSVAPVVAPGGSFVVVWNEFDLGGGQYDVMGQRFDSSGTALGAQFQVNTYTTADQGYDGVAAAADGNGNFVVVWTTNAYELDPAVFDPERVMGQRFNSAGVKQGAEFQVSAVPPCAYPVTCYPYRRWPAVAAGAAGDFVVVWASAGDAGYGGDGSGYGIIGQRFDSTGAKQGGEFQVNTYTTGDQGGAYDPISVASEAAGNFVVVWSDNNGAHGYYVAGQRFDSAGAKLGSEFRISTSHPGYLKPHVASDAAGNFVVVWNDYYTDVMAQRFDSSGAQVGAAFQVNTYTTGDQGYRGLDVASDPAGNFVVTWFGKQASGYYGVSVQQFDSTGAALGSEYQMGSGGGRFALSVDTDADGDFVVAWLDPYSAYGVVAQRFDDPPLACTPMPRNDCRQQTKARGAFRFRENAANPARSSLAWRWPRGQSTSNAEFGNVFTEVSYALCVYDGSPNPQPLLSAVVPPGGTCGPAAIPCWRELTGFGPPLFYLDGDRTQDGIVQLRLKPGATDNTRITTRARGENLTLPATPLTAPVIVQLQGSHGTCFTATYAQRIRKNEGGVFRARPGSPSAAFLDAGAAVLD